MKKLLSVNIHNKRIYGLDILRAIAILFVVIEHGKHLLPSRLNILHEIFVFDGVTIFFVLSGFLIGGILIKLFETKKPSKKLLLSFWLRRWFRTLPNYFLILLTLLGFNWLYNDGIKISEVKRYFIFSQNLFYEHPNFFPEAWSLSIEEWFYLIIPIIIFFLINSLKVKTKQTFLITTIFFLVIVILFRLFKYTQIEINSIYEWDKLFRKQVITRLDSIMYGVLSAFINYYSKTFWVKHKNSFLLIGILIFIITKVLFVTKVISFNSLYNSVFSFSITSIATALLLPYLSNLKSGSGRIHSTITLISLISYSMYLLNFSVVQLNIINKISWMSLFENIYIIVFLKYFMYWGITIIGSIIIYKYYEVPTTKFRDSKRIKKYFYNLD